MGAFKFSLKKDAPHQRPWERGRLCAVPALAPHPVAIGSRGAEGTRKILRAAALAFPTAAAPLISPKLCGPPTGLPIGTPTHNRDYNYQVMVLANRPRDFIGRCFEKGFTRSTTGIIELHSGRVYSYNQKDALWRVQYGDGQTEDFDAKDIIHYAIEQKTIDIKNGQVGKTGNTNASYEIGSSSLEPNPGEKPLAENSGCNYTPESLFSKDDGSTVENEDQEVIKPKSPDHGETFSCIFKCKRFQVIPKYNHLGEEPPS